MKTDESSPDYAAIGSFPLYAIPQGGLNPQNVCFAEVAVRRSNTLIRPGRPSSASG